MKNCLIVINSYKDRAATLGAEISAYLAGKGVHSRIYTYNGMDAQSSTGDKSGKMDLSFQDADFVITLGGDGTVLYASRGAAPLGIPVFPVNLGDFGFLAAVQVDSWKEELELFLEGKSPVAERHLVHVEVVRGGKTVFTSCGMNDAVISSAGSARLVNLNVAYNHALLGPFKANGIIVATATGSTAYSAAAGGPIADPSLKTLVLTPISSFSLSARPLVFGSEGEIAITVLPSRVSVGLTVDGQMHFALEQDDVIILGIPEYTVQLAGANQEQFYAALQSKLNWSGGPRA